MSNWLLTLPTVWLVVVVLAATWVVAGIIFLVVTSLASGERLRTMSSFSPGMLPPLGIVFGLIVAFLASGIWSNASTAQTSVNTEASSLRSAVLLVHVFPSSANDQMRHLIAQQIDQDVHRDWPAMARGTATISTVAPALGRALELAIRLKPRTEGEIAAQRELVTQVETALDARRQRIIVSHTQVNGVKWFGVTVLGFLLLLGVAFVHSPRRATAAIALTIFATAVGLSLVLVISQDRPFDGPFAIRPTALEQVRPSV